MVMIEAITRLLPGFMGNPDSLAEESHHTGVDGGLLEYPVYTKPPNGAATRFPTCCSPDITPGSPDGAATSRCGVRPNGAPTCSRSPSRDWSTATGRCSMGGSTPTAASQPAPEDPLDFCLARCLWQTWALVSRVS